MSEGHSNVHEEQNRPNGRAAWTTVVPGWRSYPKGIIEAPLERVVRKLGRRATFKFVSSWAYLAKYPRPDGKGDELRTMFIRARYEYEYEVEEGETETLKHYATWYAIDNPHNMNEEWVCAHLDQKLQPMLPNQLWPIYGVWLLELYPDHEVWVVEGEKCADFINNVLKPDGVVAVSITVYGAVTRRHQLQKYDLSPLIGRKVVYWPDNDPAGSRAGELFCSSFPDWLMVDMWPWADTLPEKWDLADLEEYPADWDAMRQNAAILDHIVEDFRRLSPEEADMPTNGELTSDRRVIIHWDPLRTELSIDNALPSLKERHRIYEMNGSVVRVSRREVIGAHTLGGPIDEAPVRNVIYEPPSEVVAEEVNRDVEFGQVVRRRIDPDPAPLWFAWQPQSTQKAVGAKLRGRAGEGLAPLLGVIDYPAIAPGQGKDTDPVVLSGQGYDPQTKLYLATPNLSIVYAQEVADAKKAYKWLEDELFADVLFETALDRATGMAALITLMVKRAYNIITPGFLVNAYMQETGKTTFINMASNLIVGTDAAAYPFGTNPEERQKQLFSIARQGPPLVCFDNIDDNGLIDCSHHSRFLTSVLVTDRVLGVSKTEQANSNFVMFYTGNNLQKSTDLQSRIFDINLYSALESPTKRNFKFQDPTVRINEVREDAISKLATIFFTNWKMRQKRKLGKGEQSRFREWDFLVREPILRASGHDILREKAEGKLPEDIRWLSEVLLKLTHHNSANKGKGLTASEMLKDTEIRNAANGLYEAVNGLKPESMAPRTLSLLLRRYEKRTVKGQQLRIGNVGPSSYFSSARVDRNQVL